METRVVKNLQQVFTDYFEANKIGILNKFISEGDISYSIEHIKQGLYEELSDMLLAETAKQYELKMTEEIWAAIEHLEHPFVLQIKNQAEKESKRPIDVFSRITQLNKNEYDFLKNVEEFNSANEQFNKALDYLLNLVYVNRSVPKFISGLNGNVEKLFVFRSLSLENPLEFLKQLLQGQMDRGLGTSWSRNGSKAMSYEGSKTNYHLRLHGFIPVEAINLEMTIVKNISGFRSEAEFFLKENELVHIFRVEMFDQNMTLMGTYEVPNPVAHKS